MRKTKNGRQKSTDIHVLDPQEDYLNEMVLLSTQNQCVSFSVLTIVAFMLTKTDN